MQQSNVVRLIVPKRTKAYPVKRGAIRPYRLWLSKERKPVRWRNYAYPWSAIDGAWNELQWLKVGSSIEVFNTSNGRHIGTFTVMPGRNFHRFVKPEFNIRFDRRTGKRKK